MSRIAKYEVSLWPNEETGLSEADCTGSHEVGQA